MDTLGVQSGTLAAGPGRVWLNAVVGVFTRDCIWRQSNPVFRHPVTALGFAAVTALVCGFFLHPRGFVLFAALLALVVLGVAWPWISVRGLRASVRFDRQRGQEDAAIAVELTIRNRWFWSSWGLSLVGGFRDTTTREVTVLQVPGRSATQTRWTFLPARRGEYPSVTPRLATGFPFGIWEAAVSVDVERRLLIWPRTFPLSSAVASGGGQGRKGRVYRNKPGTAGDILGVRPYRRGDSLRRIHWAQTARQDRLVVCEQQSQSAPAVQLIVDLDPDIHAGSQVDGTGEWAIRIAASMAETWQGFGAPISLVMGDREETYTAGTDALQRMFDRLALANFDAPPLAKLLNRPFCRDWSNGIQVVVTTDRALGTIPGPRRTRWRRWVVLKSEAFGGGPTVAPMIAPWIFVTDRNRVAQQVRSAWQEDASENG